MSRRINTVQAVRMMRTKDLILCHNVLAWGGWSLRDRDGRVRASLHGTVANAVLKQCREISTDGFGTWSVYKRLYELRPDMSETGIPPAKRPPRLQ